MDATYLNSQNTSTEYGISADYELYTLARDFLNAFVPTRLLHSSKFFVSKCIGVNHDVRDINDLKDKFIGAGAISHLMAAQLQFYEMGRAGISYVMDPKQVVFVGDQDIVVHSVINGELYMGFVHTDQIERTKDRNGNAISTDLFKVIQPNIYVLEDGTLFFFFFFRRIFFPSGPWPH